MKNKTMLVEMELPDAEGTTVTCRREVAVSPDGYWPILPAICITWRCVTALLLVALLLTGPAFADGVMQYHPEAPAPVATGSNGNNQAALMGIGVGLAITSLLVALHVRKVHKARAARMNIYLVEVK